RLEDIALAHPVGEGAEHGPRGRQRPGAEIEAHHGPATLGEEAHLPAAAAAGHQHAKRHGLRGHERLEIRGNTPGVPRHEARGVAQVPELGGGGIALREGRSRHPRMVAPNRYTSRLPSPPLMKLALALAAALFAAACTSSPPPPRLALSP